MTYTPIVCITLALVVQTEKQAKVPLPDMPAFQQPGSEYKQIGKNIWLETNREIRRVLVLGAICRRQAPLEEFMCLKNSKEHESIVQADLVPEVFHAAILAAGAKPGSVAQFDDKGFHPPTGDTIEVTIEWRDGDKNQRAKAQDWIRDLKTKDSISHPFVFAGSQQVKNPLNGESYYLGNEGDLISVANFASSIVDLAIRSSTTDSDHSFEAFTERIPAVDTPVCVILKPMSKGGERKTVRGKQ